MAKQRIGNAIDLLGFAKIAPGTLGARRARRTDLSRAATMGAAGHQTVRAVAGESLGRSAAVPRALKALRDVNFDGLVILDHSPTMVGGNYPQTAYGFAYMKALLDRANAGA